VAVEIEPSAPPRAPLSRERILLAAVALADERGVGSISMRKIAQELGVVPMALYKHVANKDELLDGMVDVVVGEIDPPIAGADWKTTVRERVLSARRALLRHRWAPEVVESRSAATPTVIAYLDSMMGILRAGGFSIDLMHHAMHAMGSRMIGFTQELFVDSTRSGLAPSAELPAEIAERFPNIVELGARIAHDEATIVGSGCDDQFEFEFALDLMLEGLERLRRKDRSQDA
jgi:AcrR family transcriptional regulator